MLRVRVHLQLLRLHHGLQTSVNVRHTLLVVGLRDHLLVDEDLLLLKQLLTNFRCDVIFVFRCRRRFLIR